MKALLLNLRFPHQLFIKVNKTQFLDPRINTIARTYTSISYGLIPLMPIYLILIGRSDGDGVGVAVVDTFKKNISFFAFACF
jgi:hypothetical protein